MALSPQREASPRLGWRPRRQFPGVKVGVGVSESASRNEVCHDQHQFQAVEVNGRTDDGLLEHLIVVLQEFDDLADYDAFGKAPTQSRCDDNLPDRESRHRAG